VRIMRAAALLLAALTVALTSGGCTIGPDRSGAAQLSVTRDFGITSLVRATEESLPEGETVMRFLRRRAKAETRYGGRFVQEIDGVRSSHSNGGRRDWFYYVNGIEADVGAAEHEVHPGDRVWWDYRDWTTAMRVPAVVGSFPEPFIHGSDGKSFPVRIDCARGADEACNQLADRLSRAEIIPNKTALGVPVGDAVLRFVVGTWDEVREDDAARLLEQGPGKSGVFARIAHSGTGYRFDLLDRQGAVAASLTSNAGIVAATRFEDQQPTWVVSGTDDAGLAQAARLVAEKTLRDRYAVASDAGKVVALPAGGAR
jgi:hypothetical protein